jgi:hypothetical protein
VGPVGRRDRVPLRDQPHIPRLRHRLDAAAHAELSENVSEVFLDGIDGDEELLGYLLVRLASHYKAQHFELSSAQEIGERVGRSQRICFGAQRTTFKGSTEPREQLTHVLRRDILRARGRFVRCARSNLASSVAIDSPSSTNVRT